MKRILKEGNRETKAKKKAEKEYIKKCRNCKCVFVYQKRDIHECWGDWNWVECPCCKYYCNVIIPRRYIMTPARADMELERAFETDGK